jgi:hypothetical protein
MESVSLRQADIWVEAQQYLSLVLREKPGGENVERLTIASRAIDQGSPWYVTPWKRQHYLGIISHDLAVAQLKANWPVRAILENLDRAAYVLNAEGNIGMEASSWVNVARAHLLAAKRDPHWVSQHQDRMQDATDRALELVVGEASDVLRANIWTGATRNALSIRAANDEDRERIRAVAELAVTHGLGDRARTLLNDPLLSPLVGDYSDDLKRVALN